MFHALWRYRYFILSSIKGELKGRFARSSLGGLWFILHPLAQTLIFSIVLAEIMRARLPNLDSSSAYPIYLLSGLAAWNLFSEILTRCITVFIEQGQTMKKIAFPRLCLPVIIWGNALLNHLLLLAAILAIFLFFGHTPGWAVLSLPLGMLLISAMAFGLGVILGVLNVFARDIGQVMTIIMQLWFWLTPVVYPVSIIPEAYRPLVEANPVTALVSLYQNALLLNQWPDPQTLILPTLVGLISVVCAFVLFRRASPELVDAL